MIKIEDLPQNEIKPGFKGQFVHTEHTTLGFWEVAKGAILPMHSHFHEQITQVLEGSFELTIEGKTQLYGPGDLVVIPSNVPHSGVALTECKILDVFNPVREDYMV